MLKLVRERPKWPEKEETKGLFLQASPNLGQEPSYAYVYVFLC